MSEIFDVAIIGAGCSGTLVAAQLLRKATRPFSVALIEREPAQFGRGVAYGTSRPCHLLNVPAGKMSAFPNEPDDFLHWAAARESALVNPPWVPEISASAFLPRRDYGDYLRATLDRAENVAVDGVRLERLTLEAEGIEVADGHVTISAAGQTALRARGVVLALGNFRPGDPYVVDGGFYASRRYYADPWNASVLPALAQTSSCLLIGSGLTMVDWAITLAQTGYGGTIHVVSRRGLWPQAHQSAEPVDFRIDSSEKPVTARRWLRQIRQPIRLNGQPWRAVIDALRADNPRLWAALPTAEQRRFLRHLRPYWDCHRHRVAPQVAACLKQWVESGQLIRHVGRVLSYREDDSGVAVSLRRRGGEAIETLRVDAVVNCSGSESDYRRLEIPLIRELLAQGIGCPDPLALGLAVDANGALIGRDGRPSPYFFTLGPPAKGMRWETTAVPEIRVQAASLADRLLAD